MSNSFSIKFYLNKDKKQGDKKQIYGRITVDRKKSEFSTPFYVEETSWDDNRNRLSKNNPVNDELVEIENSIRAVRRKMIDNQIPVTSRAIKQYYKGENSFKHYLLPFFERFISEMESKNEVVYKTIQAYKKTKSTIESLLKKHYKSKNIQFAEIDYAFISKYDNYLVSEYKDNLGNSICRNTVNKNHSRFRTVLLRAKREKIIQENPYESFALKDTKTYRDYLTIEEINAIRKSNLGGNKSLQQVRDFFLFSVYSGLRYKDAYNLKMEDIITDNKGNRIIQVMTEKTDEFVNVPLIEEALLIIERYKDTPDREVFGYVLPRYSNQKINTYVKTIAELCDIEKKITHHVARHSFATLALNNNISLEVVQKLLGHTNNKTTQIYAKMMTQTVVEEMKKIDTVFL
jgi:site-specific recombinase XerD